MGHCPLLYTCYNYVSHNLDSGFSTVVELQPEQSLLRMTCRYTNKSKKGLMYIFCDMTFNQSFSSKHHVMLFIILGTPTVLDKTAIL